MAENKEAKEVKQEKPQAKREETSIIRIAGKDINGNFRMIKALNQVKGIGLNLANAIAIVAERDLKIDRNSKMGSLSEEQIAKVEEIIKAPNNSGIPLYMLNRRRDVDSNLNMHLVGSDLTIRNKQDIEADIRNQNWRGFRHQYRQKVRGQKTRSTGRTGETIGVMKKSAAQAQAAATTAQTASQGAPAPKPAAAAAAPAKEEKK